MEINGTLLLKAQVLHQMHIFLKCMFVITFLNTVYSNLETGDVLMLVKDNLYQVKLVHILGKLLLFYVFTDSY